MFPAVSLENSESTAFLWHAISSRLLLSNPSHTMVIWLHNFHILSFLDWLVRFNHQIYCKISGSTNLHVCHLVAKHMNYNFSYCSIISLTSPASFYQFSWCNMRYESSQAIFHVKFRMSYPCVFAMTFKFLCFHYLSHCICTYVMSSFNMSCLKVKHIHKVSFLKQIFVQEMIWCWTSVPFPML